MKNLLILAAVVLTMFVDGITHNFKIESNNLIWQKVYQSENSIHDLYESLRQQGNYEKIYIVRDEVIFTINFESKNELEAFGYRSGSYPNYIKPGGKFTGYLQKKPLCFRKYNFRKAKQGPLAQLGERFAGSEEVSGSIPLGSTIYLNILSPIFKTVTHPCQTPRSHQR